MGSVGDMAATLALGEGETDESRTGGGSVPFDSSTVGGTLVGAVVCRSTLAVAVGAVECSVGCGAVAAGGAETGADFGTSISGVRADFFGVGLASCTGVAAAAR